MSAHKRRADHAAERQRRRKRLFLKRVLFIASFLALLGGILVGHLLLTGCVSVHTEDHITLEIDNSAIHVAPKVGIKANDRRHEQAI